MADELTIEVAPSVNKVVVFEANAANDKFKQVFVRPKCTNFLHLSLGNTAVQVGSVPGAIEKLSLHNEHTEDVFVKIYNHAAATAGMTPEVWRKLSAGERLPMEDICAHFTTACSVRATTTRANTGDTAEPPANTVSINAQWRAIG